MTSSNQETCSFGSLFNFVGSLREEHRTAENLVSAIQSRKVGWNFKSIVLLVSLQIPAFSFSVYRFRWVMPTPSVTTWRGWYRGDHCSRLTRLLIPVAQLQFQRKWVIWSLLSHNEVWPFSITLFYKLRTVAWCIIEEKMFGK